MRCRVACCWAACSVLVRKVSLRATVFFSTCGHRQEDCPTLHIYIWIVLDALLLPIARKTSLKIMEYHGVYWNTMDFIMARIKAAIMGRFPRELRKKIEATWTSIYGIWNSNTWAERKKTEADLDFYLSYLKNIPWRLKLTKPISANTHKKQKIVLEKHISSILPSPHQDISIKNN